MSYGCEICWGRRPANDVYTNSAPGLTRIERGSGVTDCSAMSFGISMPRHQTVAPVSNTWLDQVGDAERPVVMARTLRALRVWIGLLFHRINTSFSGGSCPARTK